MPIQLASSVGIPQGPGGFFLTSATLGAFLLGESEMDKGSTKPCKRCGQIIHKRPRDSRKQWEERAFCSRLCGNLSRPKRPIEDRFWEKVDVRGDNECWMWTGNTDNHGYGTLTIARGLSPSKAHRFSWDLHNEIKCRDMFVCHHCDTPGCVNPLHLFLGTQHDNVEDAHKKGRLKFYKHANGEQNNAATLTNEQVNKIRIEYANGITTKELEIKYQNTNIGRIIRNRVYVDPDFSPIDGNKKLRPFRKKLNPDNVDFICQSSDSSRELGKLFGVSKTTILLVRKGQY